MRRIQRRSARPNRGDFGASAAEAAPARRNNTKILKFFVAFLAAVLVIGVFSAVDLRTLVGVFVNDEGLNTIFLTNKKESKLFAKEHIYEEYNPDIVFSNVNRINLLVYGLDKDGSRVDQYTFFRPDTIFVASIDLDAKSISMISIPRDTRVRIAGTAAYDKINSSFVWGGQGYDTAEERELAGMKTLRQTVRSLIGLNINYSIGVDMTGVVKIVDTIGGVQTDVLENIYVKGSLKVPKGDAQKLSGINFLRYARYREYSRGDIDRISVQQRLFKDLFRAVVSPTNIMKVPQLVTQVKDMIKTDMDTSTLTSLAFSISEFDLSNVRTGTIPGYFLNEDELSYWGVDEGDVHEYVSGLISGGLGEGQTEANPQ
jgi:LCP family protein required for cell wall assembly